MKKIVMIFAAMAAVLSSCQKSELESVSANEIKDIVLNISVSNPGADDTKALVKTDWVEGDQIKIWFDTNTGDTPDLVIKYDESKNWKQDGPLASTPQSKGYIKAVYNNFVIVASKDDYTYTGNTLSFNIKNWKFLTEIQVVVKGIPYYYDATYKLSCDKFTPVNRAGFTVGTGDITAATAAKGGAVKGISNADGVAFVFATADYSSSNTEKKEFTFTLTDDITGSEVTKVYKPEVVIEAKPNKSSIKALAIESSKFDVPAPEYVTIGGEFSVSATKKVRFSQGNLYAKKTGDNWTWHFYSNQYDCNTLNSACVDSDRTAQSTDAEIDLFTWGYGTWSTSPIGTDCAEYPTGVFIDWGSQIGDGSTWRTLTTEEWQYLFNVRATETVSGTSDAHYARAQVNNKCGIILLPDTYSHPSGVKALANINNESATYSTNEYDEADWIKMEQAGCVFVPAAGCRSGSTIAGVGEFGYYWSSSEKFMNAALLRFGLTTVRPDGGDDRNFGYSVRLVTDASVTPAPTPTTTGSALRTGDIEVNWVQLWENGPKFAEYNVGAENSKAEDYGGYYAWGGSQDKVDDHDTGNDVLSGDNDTATKLWGSNWRMPTQAELEALTNSTNCDVEWIDGTNKKYNNTTVTGRLFTGKGAYSSCSVFLPAAGCYKDGVVTSPCSEGDYWSSTPRSGNVDRAYLLLLSSGGQQVLNFGARKDGYSVRAVLTE